jgi:hypothetical protein
MLRVPLSQGRWATIDPEDAENVLQYRWYIDRSNRSGREYARSNVYLPNGKHTTILMHRLIAGFPGTRSVVDHRNGDGLDNTRANLRVCSYSNNLMNQRPRTDGTSRFKGVSWNTKRSKWVVNIQIKGRNTYIGLAECEEEAAVLYNIAAQLFYGEYACLNPV